MVPFTERVEWTETAKPSARHTIAIIVTAAMLTFLGWCEVQAQTVTVSPSFLAFTGTEGASNPTAQAVTLWKKGYRTRTWTVSRPVPWITVTPSSGTISRERDNISVAVNLAGLTAGNYTTSVIITLEGTAKNIPVSLTVVSSPSTSGSTTTTSGGTTATSGGTTTTSGSTTTTSGSTTRTVTLSWTANTESDLAGYKVYRATASGAYGAPIATLNNSTTSYVASGLQQDTTYFFVITAYDTAANESPFSIEVTTAVN